MDGRRSRQLVLDLARDPDFTREDFLVAPSNADALAFIDLWPDWPSRTLILTGPSGSGKSHLAAIWGQRADAVTLCPGDPILAHDLARHPALILEDCDRREAADAALFHLINLMRETGGTLVMTARVRPDLWRIKTADLLSRLRLSPVVEIGHPDAALISAVLVKLFTDRQIRIETEIVSYAALHLDQSLDAVRRFVEAIDETSLSEGRRITKPLVALTIERMRAGVA